MGISNRGGAKGGVRGGSRGGISRGNGGRGNGRGGTRGGRMGGKEEENRKGNENRLAIHGKNHKKVDKKEKRKDIVEVAVESYDYEDAIENHENDEYNVERSENDKYSVESSENDKYSVESSEHDEYYAESSDDTQSASIDIYDFDNLDDTSTSDDEPRERTPKKKETVSDLNHGEESVIDPFNLFSSPHTYDSNLPDYLGFGSYTLDNNFYLDDLDALLK